MIWSPQSINSTSTELEKIMFKNLLIYKIANTIPLITSIEKSLDAERFVPLGKSQEKSIGWIEPRGEAHAPLVESINGQYMMRLKVETKGVPGSVINKKAKERAAEIERQFGRKPGKKEMKEIKEDMKMSLLPLAFSKESTHWVWIDPKAGLLMIDASGQSKADEVITMLVKSVAGVQYGLINTNKSPQAAMANWLLTQEAPHNFSVDRECELKAHDESKSAVKFSKHALDRDDVCKHIEEGKLPIRLAMTWNSRLSFSLTESLQLKKIAFLDVVFESAGDDQDGFDAAVAISTGELCKAIPDLFEALDGLMDA